ncbi:MAG: hypothetical protein JXB29_06040 [Sedimentisphaerales bacterium]|nr:hypothetical protein [Sedimentisphaerales bacterium]
MSDVFCTKTRALLAGILVFICSVCWADDEQLDKSKYISIDEVKPGMQAYCLTSYKGTEVEKFDLEVVSVVRNISPGRDAILVLGTDPRFIHTGPVAGCSGSPVYIDGRLAGALAFAWTFSKDPLYGVTPIEEMLKVGREPITQDVSGTSGYAFDYSAPVDFEQVNKTIIETLDSMKPARSPVALLPCPLVTSGLPDGVCESLGASLESMGLMVVPGLGGSEIIDKAETARRPSAKFAPGDSLIVPLATGDISMDVIGTVTEVEGETVYGFGHSFLGYGPIDLPMATGKVHTVVSSLYRSFKFASSVEIVGALRTDQEAAVCGKIGARARMIPLKITVRRYNDSQRRTYNCSIANNRLLTPLVLQMAIAGAALYLGPLPPDHMIEYKVSIGLADGQPIVFENVSTSFGLKEMLRELVGSAGLVMNNPYEKADIESIDIHIRQAAKNLLSSIWSVEVADPKVKPGQTVTVDVVVESFLAAKKKYQFDLKVPDELPAGKYDLMVCGGYDYRQFLAQVTPQKFIPQNFETLIEAINNILAVKRDELYCLLLLPASGITIEKSELPDLPATKALVLSNTKRTLTIQPYAHWLGQSIKTGSVIIDKKAAHITVER